ncbi:MAG TPA: hypothetical protein VL284_16425 [Thermoanaerobaculia bacterium]|nr:hypothetical protein [Thermoanaerobaculia bacterium]
MLASLLLMAFTVAPAQPLRIVAPADGAILRGGHFATLSWSAEQPPAGAEEWEAFLSLDGGRYYSVRLTPHLDIGVRRYDVLIPNADSDDARLLIRTGDERNETIIEMPQHLRIRAEADAFVDFDEGRGHGEPARPNEPPVVVWATGGGIERDAAPASVAATTSAPPQSNEIAQTVSRARAVFSRPDRLNRRSCSPLAARRSPSVDHLLETSRLNV